MKHFVFFLLLLPSVARAYCCYEPSYWEYSGARSGALRVCYERDGGVHATGVAAVPPDDLTWLRLCPTEDNGAYPGALRQCDDHHNCFMGNSVEPVAEPFGRWVSGYRKGDFESTETDDFVKRECDRFCQSPQSATTNQTLSGPGWMRTCDCAALLAQQKKAETCSPAHLLTVLTEVADAYGVSYRELYDVGDDVWGETSRLYVPGHLPLPLVGADKLRHEAKDLEQQAKAKQREADRLDQQDKAKADLRGVLRACK